MVFMRFMVKIIFSKAIKNEYTIEIRHTATINQMVNFSNIPFNIGHGHAMGLCGA